MPSIGNATAQKWKYNDREFEALHGFNMSEMDFRQYDPALGRFTGIDVMATMTPRINPYHFGLNNPVYFSDPTGLISIDPGLLMRVIASALGYENYHGNYGSVEINATYTKPQGETPFGGGSIPYRSQSWRPNGFGGGFGGGGGGGAGSSGSSTSSSEDEEDLGKYAEYRKVLNKLEYTGGAIEVAAVVLAPFSEGASLTLAPIGNGIFGAGTMGNVILDVMEEKWQSAGLRILKHFIFFGTGRWISRHTTGTDKYILELYNEFGDKLIF